MNISQTTLNFKSKYNVINFKQNNSAKEYNINASINQGRKIAEEHNKRSSRNVLLASFLSTAVGTTIGVLASPKKVKFGLIGGLIGLVAGYLGSCITNTHIQPK